MWEPLVDKLSTIYKWDASCLYHVSLQISVGGYVLLSRLERLSIRPWEVGNLSILTQGAYIERCRLKVEDATLSI